MSALTGRISLRSSVPCANGSIAKNRRVERFETEAGEDGSITVKVQFADALAAELFRREFQGNYGD
jgi:hypothetical protein